MKKELLIALASLLLLSSQSAIAAEKSQPLKSPFPFHGEVMKFSVGWEFVTAGTATMIFKQPEGKGYRINTDARTNKFFDMFKKVRDSIISKGEIVDNKPQSTLFDIKQQERSYRATKKTEFLWKEGKVRYTHNKNVKEFKVPAGHLNVIDAFFLTRTLPVQEGKVLKIPVFDSGKKYQIEVRLLKKEKIRAPWGKLVETLVIEPRLKSAGIFSSVGTMKVWLTNDARRIPLKMTAKIKIGRIIARLTDYKKPDA